MFPRAVPGICYRHGSKGVPPWQRPSAISSYSDCITVAKYWKEWSDPRWITLVLNNRDLNQVTWEQRIMTGDIKFNASQDLPDFPYAKFAEQCGLRGIRV